MSTPHVLLGLLADHPRHGYDLKHAYDQRLPKAKPLAFGQVYATLSRLERDGLAAAVGSDQAAGPERVTYEITDQGRATLDDWLATVETPAPHITSTLLAKVMVAVLIADADAATQYLTAQTAAHKARMRELTVTKTNPSSSIGDVVAADYAIQHLDADLRWLTTTLDRVSDLYQEAHP